MHNDTDVKIGPGGIVVAGLGGGSGKSVVAVGLVSALASAGRVVVPFKKGPDYIDAGWLTLAAGRPCCNLDLYLMSQQGLLDSFVRHARGADAVIIEGNRGLYDGVDAAGTFSTAELSLLLKLPVLLVVDCTKVTRTVAALVLGCRELDPRVRIAGVVLNRVAGQRHETTVRQAVEQYTGIPVLGAIPKRKDAFPQRHLGVTPIHEHNAALGAVQTLGAMAREFLDLERIEACKAPLAGTASGAVPPAAAPGRRVRIGILQDAAFQFYYPENLEALAALGAEIVPVDALSASSLPGLDGLYIGGGFPETNAELLAANISFRAALRERIAAGLPVYAECGGLIYLGESIVLDGREYPLAGVFPVRFGLAKRPQAHGYSHLVTEGANPFYPQGQEIRGHEFRYSTVLDWRGESRELVFRVARGTGFWEGRDGLTTKNVLALYTHVHAVGTPAWAEGLVAAARR